MTTSLVRPSAVISGAQVQRALEWREQQIVELVEAAHRPHAAGETVKAHLARHGPVRRIHRHGCQRHDELPHPQWRLWRHCGGDPPGPLRALPRHRSPVQLGEHLYGPDVLNPAHLSTAHRPA